MLAGTDPGKTPLDTPVEKMIAGIQVVRSSSLGEAAAPPCSSGPCCGGGMCGIE
ncbi:MAG: regulator [Gammaproteobacteria bacterium]